MTETVLYFAFKEESSHLMDSCKALSGLRELNPMKGQNSRLNALTMMDDIGRENKRKTKEENE
jgi:hypothetical protein